MSLDARLTRLERSAALTSRLDVMAARRVSATLPLSPRAQRAWVAAYLVGLAIHRGEFCGYTAATDPRPPAELAAAAATLPVCEEMFA